MTIEWMNELKIIYNVHEKFHARIGIFTSHAHDSNIVAALFYNTQDLKSSEPRPTNTWSRPPSLENIIIPLSTSVSAEDMHS